MKSVKHILYISTFLLLIIGCAQPTVKIEITAADILGNPEYLAMSYGGYRQTSRDVQPTIDELKEDMRILSAMGVKIIRTYNVHFSHAANLLQAIKQLRTEIPDFEMYVMLGAWIDCKNAWTDNPIHNLESDRNAIEIATTIELANEYPDIVKIIAVGNEAMVKWAAGYFVEPGIILKWVLHLQELKKSGDLPKDLWITSSDNFASWGGGDPTYHVEDLNQLIQEVDFISMHTYPMHDTHYNPVFWRILESEIPLPDSEKIDAAMLRAKKYAISQYESVKNYMNSLDVNKPIHLGETGWASVSNSFYGDSGTRATDEYKAALYYKHMRQWSNENKISCFYFEAFDEQWKDAANPKGSENHFGLINLKGEAKYALWNLVDSHVFEGLTRDGKSIKKTFNGDKDALLNEVLVPSFKTIKKD